MNPSHVATTLRSAAMDLNVQTILAGLILAGILWLAKTVNENSKTLTVLQTILTGADGDNGINSEVKQLRRRSHEQGDNIHTLFGKHDLHEQRIVVLEEDRRIGPADRRAV